MEDKDFEQFCEVMEGVAYNFSTEVDKEGLKYQFRLLKNYTIGQFEKAADWLVLNRKKDYPKMPALREFIEIITEDTDYQNQNKPVWEKKREKHCWDLYVKNQIAYAKRGLDEYGYTKLFNNFCERQRILPEAKVAAIHEHQEYKNN